MANLPGKRGRVSCAVGWTGMPLVQSSSGCLVNCSRSANPTVHQEGEKIASRGGFLCDRWKASVLRPVRAFPALAAVCVAVVGCQSPLDVSRLKLDNDEKMRELASIDDTRGPLERVLQAAHLERARHDRSLAPAAGLEEYQQAEALYEQGKFKQAEKAFKKIAKNKDYQQSPVREDALFMIAETQFALERYAYAQDSYDRLMKEFPSTRHLERSVKQLFSIAQTWLEFPQTVTPSEIQLVDFENPQATPPPTDPKGKPKGLTRRIPIFPEFWDRRRPMFDTDGRALQALKSIWLNDPTGPLADDALMMTASHYLRKGDYIEADHIYSTLREEYPQSPHLENAFVLGSHVKLMSYQGSAYDGKSLESAGELKESTLRLYPNNSAKARIENDLRKIEEAKADRDWKRVQFWQKKKKPRAVAVYCNSLIENYPTSSYADLARQKLAELGPEYSRNVAPLGEQQPGRELYEGPEADDLQRIPEISDPAYDPPGRANL